MGDWIKVTVPRQSYSFPQRCPDCLRTGPLTNLVLTFEPKPKRSYVIASHYQCLNVEVPYCEECAVRQLRLWKLARVLTVAGLVTGLGIGFWFHLGRWAGIGVAAAGAFPGIWLRDYHRAARINTFDDDTVTFSFKCPEYATEFMAANHIQEEVTLTQ